VNGRTGSVNRDEALLVLADGTTFEGEAIGAPPAGGVAVGEAVFNTVLSGYQEVITDHIGNYGTNPTDDEATRPHCRGIIVRDLTDLPSSWRSTESLEEFLIRWGVPGVTGIDTRRLTRHLRSHGSMPCAFGTAPVAELTEVAATAPGTGGQDLVATVTTDRSFTRGTGPYRVVAFDFGIKEAMVRQLGDLATVTVVPAFTPADEVLALDPDGVFLSNGPGDPADLPEVVDQIRLLLEGGRVPVFGICLGHQLLATALGATTYKLPFGHHGGNHPVKRLSSGRVEITSQNHNYAVAEGSLSSAEVTHVNLNDGVIEGIASRDVPAFSVQYHPEAGPGPHDARYLFGEFRRLMDATGATARGGAA
jgi:carbamoyl-phosphate synthase small subunit